jgi:hypothetical protein
MSLLPRIRQPVGQLTDRRIRKIGQQLREIPLRIDLIPAAGAGDRTEDRRGLPGPLVAHEQAVLSVMKSSS